MNERDSNPYSFDGADNEPLVARHAHFESTARPDDLVRLVTSERLRTLKARFCRYVSTHAWADVDRLFTAHGQVRAYGADGELVCFADAPRIGAVLAERYDDRVLVVQAFLEELTVNTAVRAEGVWAVESLVVLPEQAESAGRRSHGYGYLTETYELHGDHWLIRSLEFTRHLLEHT